MWRSQLSRSPTAACGGHPQRSSRIAAAACARRALCEPFEAAPSFLCHGVVAAREFARCPAIANFTLCGKRGAASYCGLLQAVAKSVDLGPRTADQPVWERERKAPAAEEGGAGLDRRTDGRSMAKNRERGAKTRAVSTVEARTSRRCGRRPVATRTPAGGTMRDARAQVRGCTSQCFCVPHFTGAAAAETLPQRHQQTTHSSRQHGLRPLATEAEAAVAAEARFSRAARLGTQRPQVLRGLRAAERFEFRVLRDRGFM